MSFQELVEQHRVYLIVTHAVRFSLFVVHDQSRIHLFHIFSHQPQLWIAFGIDFLLVMKYDRLKRKEYFARPLHRFNFFLEPPRRDDRAKLVTAVNNNRSSFAYRSSKDIADVATVAYVSTGG